MRLAVVTPSLDAAPFVREAVESVLGQSVAAEYVVRDGGSADGTLEVLRRYEGRLRLTSGPDGGQARAVNLGFAETQAEVLGWLNADDAYEPGAFAAALAAFEADPELDLVYGEGEHVDAAGAPLGRYPTEDWDWERLAEACFVCQPTVFLRRRVLERFGPLDERLRFCMDYEYWLRIARGVRTRRLDRRLARSRLHPGAKTLRQRVAAHAEINDMLLRRLGRVPTRWIHSYAFAVVDAAGHDRARPRDYVWTLLWRTAWGFVRWQGRLPREMADVARYWLGRAYGRDGGGA